MKEINYVPTPVLLRVLEWVSLCTQNCLYRRYLAVFLTVTIVCSYSLFLLNKWVVIFIRDALDYVS